MLERRGERIGSSGVQGKGPRSLTSRLPRSIRLFLARLQQLGANLFWNTLGRVSSRLARRILFLNMLTFAALLVGVLWLNQTRVGVIDARVQSLLIQSEIIAAAIAGQASVDTDSLAVDPEKLLQLRTGETVPDDNAQLKFSINPVQVAPVLRRLVMPTRTRARVFDREGQLLLDSRDFYYRGDVIREALPPPGADQPTLIERTWSSWKRRFGRAEIPFYEEATGTRNFQEVTRALNGVTTNVVRVAANGYTIVSVAVPIQRFRSVQGALMLSTQEGDIDSVIEDERWNIITLFAGVAFMMVLLSMLMANTIARPIERLAEGADRVRRSIKSRHQIPDFSDRPDEIGHLSVSLREMTNALYARMEAIESFAADVAHELKNPLTSLRSAVETLPLARTDESRGRLMAIIQHDVRRLDRLISDISDASRLDAELARGDAQPVDLAKVVTTVVSVANEMRQPNEAEVKVRILPSSLGRDAYLVIGHDSRLGQVFNNLIDNARSFSPAGRPIQVMLRREGSRAVFTVDDEGPGIPEHALERIFERFYTDRPTQTFGQNSGLGLSISRQIIEAHRGRIWAENRRARTPVSQDPNAPEPAPLGARFTVTLPLAMKRS